MYYREATIYDIIGMHAVRISVNENKLSDPNRITEDEYRLFLTERGRGWVCETVEGIAGFSVVDLQEKNVWALFVHPDSEGQGIGRKLQKLLLDWYFGEGYDMIWLSTAPGTRAEDFYRKSGWNENGRHGNHELRFEMKLEVYRSVN